MQKPKDNDLRDMQSRLSTLRKTSKRIAAVSLPDSAAGPTPSRTRGPGHDVHPPGKGASRSPASLEGNSIRSTERITELDRNTICTLLVLAGERCERLLADTIRKFACATWRPMRYGASSARRKRQSELSTTSRYTRRRLYLRRNGAQSKLILAWHWQAQQARHSRIHLKLRKRHGRKIPANNGRLALLSRCG